MSSVRAKAIKAIKSEIRYNKNQIKSWELTWIYTQSEEEVAKAKKRIEQSEEAIDILEYILKCVEAYNE